MQITNDTEMTSYRAVIVQGCLWKISLLRNKYRKGASPTAQQKRICLPCKSHRRHNFDPWGCEDPLEKTWQLTRVFLLRESHGQRSLAGYSL